MQKWLPTKFVGSRPVGGSSLFHLWYRRFFEKYQQVFVTVTLKIMDEICILHFEYAYAIMPIGKKREASMRSCKQRKAPNCTLGVFLFPVMEW